MAKKVEGAFDLEISDETWDALLRQDFGWFAREMFNEVTPGVNLVWAPYLDFLSSRLEDVVHGRRRNLIITLPPRHLKSYLASVALPSFFLGHNPGLEVMCVSYGQDLARKFGEDTQTLMSSARYRGLFGDVLMSRRQSPNALMTRQGGIRRATSLEGSATGVGADLMIFDDPQKAGETISDANRRASNQAFETTFLSRRNDPATCRMVIVMQRLHEDDFVGHVLGLGGDWEVINLPAIAPEAEAYAYASFLGDHIFVRRQGEALHPARVPLAELKLIRDNIGEAAWASQYMQSPAPAGGGVVKLEWFRRYTDADRPDSFDRVLQSWDTANTVKGAEQNRPQRRAPVLTVLPRAPGQGPAIGQHAVDQRRRQPEVIGSPAVQPQSVSAAPSLTARLSSRVASPSRPCRRIAAAARRSLHSSPSHRPWRDLAEQGSVPSQQGGRCWDDGGSLQTIGTQWTLETASPDAIAARRKRSRAP